MMKNSESKLTSKIARVAFVAMLAGCASTSRACASCDAENFGADWVVVQMDNDGRPYRCWVLHDVSISSESGDGVYWKDADSGNLIHISGHFNRVQVVGRNLDNAYTTLGLTEDTCAKVRGQMYDPDERTFKVRSADDGSRARSTTDRDR